MPSERKRIGFLPSKEVQEIIDNLCRANEFSQSKVTGLLVEEALRSRGVLSDSFPSNKKFEFNFTNKSFQNELFSKKNSFLNNNELYKVNKKELSEDIKMMYEFIEYKYFKKVMKQNNNILDE